MDEQTFKDGHTTV